MSEPSSELRCGLCHDALTGADQVRCPGCATLLHGECRTQLGRCPTLGCAEGTPSPGPAPKPPEHTLFSERQIVWSGVLFSPVAGVTLLAINCARVGRRRAGVVLALLVWSVFLVGPFASSAVSSSNGWILVLGVVLAISLGRLGREDIQRHQRTGGLKANTLVAAVLCLVSAGAYMGAILALGLGLMTGLSMGIDDRLAADDHASVERLCSVALTLTDGEDAHALSARAMVRFRQGRHAEGIADVERALRIAPADARLFAQRAHGHLRQGEARAALGDLDRAIQLDPEDAWAFANRRWARALLGDHEGSVADAEVAARLDPSAENLKSLADLRAQAKGR